MKSIHEPTNREIAAAVARGNKRLASEPLAVSARYDVRNDRIVIELNSGFLLGIPRRLLEGLEKATPAQLKRVEILGPGTAIAWNAPDVGFSIVGLMRGLVGSPTWMKELGRAGGSARTAAKAKAARANGAKGGRPARQAAG